MPSSLEPVGCARVADSRRQSRIARSSAASRVVRGRAALSSTVDSADAPHSVEGPGVATPLGFAAPPHDHAAHEEAHDGAAMTERSQLYFSRLDGSLRPRGVARGVCYCCKTTIAAGPDGSLYAAWRHVYPGDMRDIAFALSRDAGRTFTGPVRVSEDKWALTGCPENGPALAVDVRNRVHLVWPTIVSGSTAGSDPTLGLFYSTTVDGRAFTARQRIATAGTPYHPQIAVSRSGALLLAWDELGAGTRRVAVARGGFRELV